MKMTANLKGMDTILNNMDIYAKQMDIGVQAALEKVVEIIVEHARDKAPIDTGKLKSSITGVVRQIERDVFTGHIEAAAHYASFIEYGTSDSKAQPFLEPAVEEGMNYIIREMKAAHKRAASKLKKNY